MEGSSGVKPGSSDTSRVGTRPWDRAGVLVTGGMESGAVAKLLGVEEDRTKLGDTIRTVLFFIISQE